MLKQPRNCERHTKEQNKREIPGRASPLHGITQEIANFAIGTKFNDLPKEVVHESKRILLDCIGCGLAGLGTDKGKTAAEMARKLGGAGEATIVGIGDCCSYFGASFANAELINAMDYEVLCGGHISALTLASSLALAEGMKASGKELIRAIAIAHEIGYRLGTALPTAQGEDLEKPGLPPVAGWNYAIFGGTAGAGTLLNLDQHQMVHALGIAGYMVPAQAVKKFVSTVPVARAKYAPVGWINQAELTAAFLAQIGQTGDTTVLEGEYGFWRYIGSSKWEPAAMMKELGQSWRFPSLTVYKLYPCCGVLSAALDCFINIIDENKLQPEDIDGVRIYLDPRCEEPVWRNNEIETDMEAQFSVAYNISVAAHRVNIGWEWQDSNTYQNPKILEFMKKVSFSPHPDYAKIVKEDPTARPNRADVIAKGRTFSQERKHPKGASINKATRITDEELVDKFQNNANRILLPSKIDKATEAILSLEKIANVSKLIELVTVQER